MRIIPALFFALGMGLVASQASLAEEQENFGKKLLRDVLDKVSNDDQDNNQSADSHQEKIEQDQQRQQAQQQSTDADFIECPVEKLRTEVVTRLPSAWWQTPQIGGLKDTRIQHIGGKETLLCAYRGYGDTVSIMRLPPAGTSCEARTRGFACY